MVHRRTSGGERTPSTTRGVLLPRLSVISRLSSSGQILSQKRRGYEGWRGRSFATQLACTTFWYFVHRLKLLPALNNVPPGCLGILPVEESEKEDDDADDEEEEEEEEEDEDRDSGAEDEQPPTPAALRPLIKKPVAPPKPVSNPDDSVTGMHHFTYHLRFLICSRV